jgi:tetratricopeptide (TPR) repeat protein/predicted Ser/Thr protein kinase
VDELETGPTLDTRADPGRDSSGALIGRAPKRIGRFTVLHELGRGGMGIVYMAYDVELDRGVAIKVLRRASDKATERLRREAQAMAKLSHPNVAQIYEVGTHEGQVYLAMEFVKGKNLREWVAEGDASREDILEAFRQAGRGLAAAHEAGLVHRDFKPANVIVGFDGRVRVLDFGLASMHEGSSGRGRPSVDFDLDEVSMDGTGSIGSNLTQTGSSMGTPAYMSPEQFRSRGATAKSDQFSFCVALYEALYGERPFAGRGTALGFNVTKGKVRVVPAGARVPSWLRQILLEGLSVEPENRFEDMEALLSRLSVDPIKKRKSMIMWSAALLAIVGAFAGAELWRTSDGGACTGASDQISGVWDGARKAQVQSAIVGTRMSFAPGTWRRVEKRLDGYVGDWTAAYEEACEATHVRHEQGSEVMDMRMRCLDGRLQDVKGVVDALVEVDAKNVSGAVSAVTGLRSLEPCSDLEYLESRVKPPDDPGVAQRVEALRAELATARGLKKAGKVPESLELAKGLMSRAEAIAYKPLLAELLHFIGKTRAQLGESEGVEETLTRAYFEALSAGDDEAAVDAATGLVFVVGHQGWRFEDGHAWAQHARALLDHFEGRDPGREASLVGNVGTMYVAKGDHEMAIEHFERGIEIRTEAFGEDDPGLRSYLFNIGVASSNLGRHSEAERLYRRALEIEQRTFGEEHPSVASTYKAIGSACADQKKYAEAEEHLDRALKLWSQVFGPDHPKVAEIVLSIGSLKFEQGDHDAARTQFERALEIREQQPGANAAQIATPLSNLGNVHREKGEYDLANQKYARALDMLEEGLEADHAQVAVPLLGLGETAIERGETVEAVAYLERATRIMEAADSNPARLARARFLLADALWQVGAEEQRALVLAGQSRTALAEMGSPGADELVDVERWLSERQP